MSALDQFIDQLIKDKNYPAMDEDVLDQMKADLAQRLVDQIDRAAFEALPEDKAIELNEKMDDPEFSQSQLQQFMVNSGVDLQQVTLNTMFAFRRLYLGEAAYE